MELKELLFSLAGQMSVVGFEERDEEALTALVAPLFDEHEYDAVGNHLFLRRCGKADAKRVFLDAHYDEVGLIVKGITDDGFLRVTKQGGVDARLFPAEELVVYGKEKLPGIVLTKTRELMNGEETGKLVGTSDLLIDIGCTSRKEAEALAPIGTPVGFTPVYTELAGGYVAGKGFDDKCCAALLIDAVSKLDMTKLDCDIYVSLSAREEVGHRAVSAAAFRIAPDMAIAIDVTFGMAPEGKKPGDSDMKGGPVLSLTATLDPALEADILRVAKEKEITVQTVVEAVDTGTHADDIYLCAGGISTALLGVPLWFMHTANEVIALEDLEKTAALVSAVLTDRYGKEGA